MSVGAVGNRGLNAWYGESHILHGVDFSVEAGEVVTLLGRNGSGRTTTLRAIMGLVGKRVGVDPGGRCGETIKPAASHRIARKGIGYCPEERGIFSTLSAEENLRLPPTRRSRLAERHGRRADAGRRDLHDVPQPPGTCEQSRHAAVRR